MNSIARPIVASIVRGVARGAGGSGEPVVYPELYPQPEFDATTGLTIGTGWAVTGGEAVNSGSTGNLDGLLNEAIVPGASYSLVVGITGFADDADCRPSLEGVSAQIIGTLNSSESPQVLTINFTASANANTSLRFRNILSGAGSLQSVSLKRTA